MLKRHVFMVKVVPRGGIEPPTRDFLIPNSISPVEETLAKWQLCHDFEHGFALAANGRFPPFMSKCA
jgi:hypothetical protein